MGSSRKTDSPPESVSAALTTTAASTQASGSSLSINTVEAPLSRAPLSTSTTKQKLSSVGRGEEEGRGSAGGRSGLHLGKSKNARAHGARHGAPMRRRTTEAGTRRSRCDAQALTTPNPGNPSSPLSSTRPHPRHHHHHPIHPPHRHHYSAAQESCRPCFWPSSPTRSIRVTLQACIERPVLLPRPSWLGQSRGCTHACSRRLRPAAA